MYDTAGVKDYGGVTKFAIRDSDVVIFLPSFDSFDSLYHIKEYWLEKITDVLKEDSFIPIFSVNKCDIEPDSREFTENNTMPVAHDHRRPLL